MKKAKPVVNELVYFEKSTNYFNLWFGYSLLNTIILLYHKCNILNVQALKRDNYFYITKIKSYFYLFLIKLDFYLLIKLCFYLLVIKLCFYVYLIKLYVYFLIIKFYLYIFLIKLCFKINKSTFFLFLIKLYSFKNQFLLFK